MLPTREKHCCCPCVSNGSQKCNNSIWMRSVSKMKANLEKMEFRLESRDDTSSTLCWGFLLQHAPPPVSSAAQERDPLKEICKGASDSSTGKKQDYYLERMQHDLLYCQILLSSAPSRGGQRKEGEAVRLVASFRRGAEGCRDQGWLHGARALNMASASRTPTSPKYRYDRTTHAFLSMASISCSFALFSTSRRY